MERFTLARLVSHLTELADFAVMNEVERDLSVVRCHASNGLLLENSVFVLRPEFNNASRPPTSLRPPDDKEGSKQRMHPPHQASFLMTDMP